jgi:hypothetical protein
MSSAGVERKNPRSGLKLLSDVRQVEKGEQVEVGEALINPAVVDLLYPPKAKWEVVVAYLSSFLLLRISC